MWQLVGFDYKWEGGVGLGPEDSGMPGLGDARTWGCRDLGLGDAGTWDSGTQKRGNRATRGHKDVGAQGRRDKQITPEFAVYIFWWSRERYCIIEFNKLI